MVRKLSSFLVSLGVLALCAGPAFAAPLGTSQAPAIGAQAPVTHHTLLGQLAAGLVGLAVFGTITIKDTGTLAKKFVTRAVAAAPDYKDGVAAKGADWENSTAAAEGNYEQGVQASIGRKAFGKGVRGSASKYQQNASTLGAQRYGPGVQNAQDAWARGVQPSLDVLKSLNLPLKGPKRSPQNSQRSNAVILALGALKENK